MVHGITNSNNQQILPPFLVFYQISEIDNDGNSDACTYLHHISANKETGKIDGHTEQWVYTIFIKTPIKKIE